MTRHKLVAAIAVFASLAGSLALASPAGAYFNCTYVKGNPSGAVVAHGCQFAFTS